MTLRKTALCAIVLFIAFVWLCYTSEPTPSASKQVPRIISLPPAPLHAPMDPVAPMTSWRSVSTAYFNEHQRHSDQPWLLGTERLQPQEMRVIIERNAPDILDLMRPYRNCDPLAQRIMSQFTQSRWSIAAIGENGMPANLDPMVFRQPEGPHVIKFCWIAQRFWRHPGFYGTNFGYDAGTRAVRINAMRWPQATLIARAYHELGHALLHQVDALPSATAEMMSDSWLEEEIICHTLETKVLNAIADGRLFPLLDGVLNRQQDVSDNDEERWTSIFESLTLEDLQAFDRLYDQTSTGYQPSKTQISHYVFALADRDATRHPSAQGKTRQMMAFYRWQRRVQESMR